VGILMNTRGLMELVILTIGLQMGFITDAVFAMMVLMALVTTAMTTPVLNLVYPMRLFETAAVDEKTAEAEFGVLVPVSRPESGPGLARVAGWLGHNGGKVKVYALNLRRQTAGETLAFSGTDARADLQEGEEPLMPLLEEAKRLAVPAELLTFPSRDVPSDIARVARAKRADLVLMGFHQPVIGNTILGGNVHRVVAAVDADVAILVDRGLADAPRILVPYQGSVHDGLAVELAKRLVHAPGVCVTVLYVAQEGEEIREEELKAFKGRLPKGVLTATVQNTSPVDAVLQFSGQYDLVVVGMSEDWGLESHLFGLRAERIAQEWQGSLLLVRKNEPMAGLQMA
jgi:nucleotide-binding universal stress UspA family protein